MSLGCARCGDCCNPVEISGRHADQMTAWWLYWERGGKVGSRGGRVRGFDMISVRFGALHWTEIERHTHESGDVKATLRCDAYDPGTASCTAYEDRPPVCTNYPWYGREDDESIRKAGPHLERRCSFLLDVPPANRGPDARPLIPITPRSAA